MPSPYQRHVPLHPSNTNRSARPQATVKQQTALAALDLSAGFASLAHIISTRLTLKITGMIGEAADCLKTSRSLRFVHPVGGVCSTYAILWLYFSHLDCPDKVSNTIAYTSHFTCLEFFFANAPHYLEHWTPPCFVSRWRASNKQIPFCGMKML